MVQDRAWLSHRGDTIDSTYGESLPRLGQAGPTRGPEGDNVDRFGLLAAAVREYAIFVLDPHGYVTSWNPGAERIKGYRAEEIVGRHFSAFHTPEQVAAGAPQRELERAAAAGSHIGQGWRVRKDGTRFWAAVVITALRDSNGALRGFAKVVRDETEAHTRLERSSQRFTDLFALTPVGIGLFDQAGRLVDANSALCGLVGYSRRDLDGMPATELLHPRDRAEDFLPAVGEPVDQSGEANVSHRVLIRSDGQPLYCDLRREVSVQDDGSLFWLVVFQDVTERHQQAEALRHQAMHDALTGLPNRRAVNDRLSELLASPDAERVAVLFCDIDNFKRVNDSLGHDAGDELLVALARRLQRRLPEGCQAARLSGDEFVVICPDTDAVGGIEALSASVAALLRTAVPLRNQIVRVSAAVGAASPGGSEVGGSGSATAAGEDLLRFADAAMFEAKRRGTGRVSLANPALVASADRQLQLEGQLREAIDNDGLTLHYQPVVASDGTVVTAEALVRWPHPERGLLLPDAFLPVAEQGDLLDELDRWVLRTALREAATWPSVHGRGVGIAVNLAGLIPDKSHFVHDISEIIRETGIAWHRVILELVESCLIDLPSRPRQAMEKLTERGVRFAVDDFGTGYSSLARLKDLPAQIIKADRRFAAGVGTDPCDFAVARAVADMARAMGRQCVAEGVETATQFHILSSVGVDACQGWLFSRPVPAQQFRAILESQPTRSPNRV